MMRDSSEIISAFFDDALADGEMEWLRAWLAEDRDHVRQFVRESVIHSRTRDVLVQQDMRGLMDGRLFADSVDPQHVASLLEEAEEIDRRAREAYERARQFALAAAGSEKPASAPRVTQSSRSAIIAGLAAAAVLLIMLGRWLAPVPSPAEAQLQPPRNTGNSARPVEPVVIASIGDAIESTISRDGSALPPRSNLTAGRIEVTSGAAEVKFTTGTKLVIEGPAEIELISADRARLLTGRAVAQVPREAFGFTLFAGAASIVDLGTEFGVEIGRNGDSQVHVLDGEVALVAGNKNRSPSQTLQEGVANAVSVDGIVEKIPFQHEKFLRYVPRTAYELAVLKSRPLAYWTLEREEPGKRQTSVGRLPLAAHQGPGVQVAALDTRRNGAVGPLGAATFSEFHEGLAVYGDQTLGTISSLSLEAWVLPRPANDSPQRIISTFDRPRSGIAVGVVDGEWNNCPLGGLKLHLTVYGVYDCVAETPLPRNEWVHIAATVDDAGQPLLYVNGNRTNLLIRSFVGRTSDDKSPPWTADGPIAAGRPTAGLAVIGRNPSGSDGQVSPELWQGSIAHVAVYDRALTHREVREHADLTRTGRVQLPNKSRTKAGSHREQTQQVRVNNRAR